MVRGAFVVVETSGVTQGKPGTAHWSAESLHDSN